MKEFLEAVISAYKNITWPNKKLLIKSSLAVLVISVIISAYLIGLDTIFLYLRNLILFK